LSPVFRHGSLRLYLLRLLDEEPRHGYEVIRLLRDRFMGVYSPSPGTIYPRLARLEEEGLVTHDEVDGRKVYRITEAGREELRSRSDELDELEEELSASVSDIVREVKEDVRQTVRSLREELTWAARESRRMGREMATDVRDQAKQAREEAREQARQAKEQVKEQARQAKEQAHEQARQARDEGIEQPGQVREEQARPADSGDPRGEKPGSQEPSGEGRGPEAARRVHEQARRLREEAQRARDEAMTDARSDEPAGVGARFSPGEHDWDGPGWSQGPGWTDWPGRRGWEDWARARGRGGWPGGLDFGTLRDLERVAIQFTSELRKLAVQSSATGENVISDLRGILEEALDRVKSEIFGPGREAGGKRGPGSASAGTAPADSDTAPADAVPADTPPADTPPGTPAS
jgi:DNA-binding PadR family transcriptional regulator